MLALAAGAMGYLLRPAGPATRLALLAAALLLIKPGLYTDLAGFGLLGAVLLSQRLRAVPAMVRSPS